MKLLDFIIGLFKPNHGFCKKLPVKLVPVTGENGRFLSFEEWKFFSGLKRLPTDEELVADFTKMSERTKMKFDTIMIYRCIGTVRTTRIQTNPGDTPRPAKMEDILSTFFDLSFGNSIRGIEFAGSVSYYDIIIYVEESLDGTTNITPMFMDFIKEFWETHMSPFTP